MPPSQLSALSRFIVYTSHAWGPGVTQFPSNQQIRFTSKFSQRNSRLEMILHWFWFYNFGTTSKTLMRNKSRILRINLCKFTSIGSLEILTRSDLNLIQKSFSVNEHLGLYIACRQLDIFIPSYIVTTEWELTQREYKIKGYHYFPLTSVRCFFPFSSLNAVPCRCVDHCGTMPPASRQPPAVRRLSCLVWECSRELSTQPRVREDWIEIIRNHKQTTQNISFTFLSSWMPEENLFLFLENASRKCLASGEWDNLTDYGNCLRFPSSVEDVASDISLYIYLVGMEAWSK